MSMTSSLADVTVV